MELNILGKNYNINTTTNLYLKNNKLKSIPSEIGNFINLKHLYLSDNQLESLPSEIGNLVNLQFLKLDNNKLKSLPSEIGNLVNLKVLNLYNNQLESLPSEICNLVNLQHLFLSNNKLKTIPVEILKIKNKIWIDESSYEIDNLDLETEFIFLTDLNKQITNLPITLKEIWLEKNINKNLIKIPFGCKIKYFV